MTAVCNGWWSWTPKLAVTLFVVVSSAEKGSMHARFHMWKMCVALPGGTFATLWQHELGGETAHGVAKVKAKVASDSFTTPPLYLSHTTSNITSEPDLIVMYFLLLHLTAQGSREGKRGTKSGCGTKS